MPRVQSAGDQAVDVSALTAPQYIIPFSIIDFRICDSHLSFVSHLFILRYCLSFGCCSAVSVESYGIAHFFFSLCYVMK